MTSCVPIVAGIIKLGDVGHGHQVHQYEVHDNMLSLFWTRHKCCNKCGVGPLMMILHCLSIVVLSLGLAECIRSSSIIMVISFSKKVNRGHMWRSDKYDQQLQDCSAEADVSGRWFKSDPPGWYAVAGHCKGSEQWAGVDRQLIHAKQIFRRLVLVRSIRMMDSETLPPEGGWLPDRHMRP